MISANHTFKAAKPDGLTVGHFIGGLFLQQLLGKPGIELVRLAQVRICWRAGTRQFCDRRA